MIGVANLRGKRKEHPPLSPGEVKSNIHTRSKYDPGIVPFSVVQDGLILNLIRGKEITCPCCGGLVKIYHRKIYEDMAKALIALYRKSNDGSFVHLNELSKNSKYTTYGGGDYAKLSCWGLAELKPRDPKTSKKTSGFWRITDKGCDFVLGKIKIPQYITIFHGEVVQLYGEPISIGDCFKDRFDYEKLMNDTW